MKEKKEELKSLYFELEIYNSALFFMGNSIYCYELKFNFLSEDEMFFYISIFREFEFSKEERKRIKKDIKKLEKEIERK